MTAHAETDRYTRPRQYWRFDLAVDWAHVYANLSGRRFTCRRYGTTSSGKPIWDIRPAVGQP